MCRLAKEHQEEVRAILEVGSAAAPEALLLAFTATHADWGPLQHEVCSLFGFISIIIRSICTWRNVYEGGWV